MVSGPGLAAEETSFVAFRKGLRMLDKELAELKVKLDAIAAGTTVRAPDDWRRTKIGRWSDDGLVEEAARISGDEWWRRPSNSAGSELNALLQRAGLSG